jgi:hypothetical protein
MNGTTDRLVVSRPLTRFLWWLSTLLFVLAETMVIIAILRNHGFHSVQDYLNTYGRPLIVSVPWVLGMRGYSLVEKEALKSQSDQFSLALLSRQFLYTEISAYMMLSFFSIAPFR